MCCFTCIFIIVFCWLLEIGQKTANWALFWHFQKKGHLLGNTSKSRSQKVFWKRLNVFAKKRQNLSLFYGVKTRKTRKVRVPPYFFAFFCQKIEKKEAKNTFFGLYLKNRFWKSQKKECWRALRKPSILSFLTYKIGSKKGSNRVKKGSKRPVLTLLLPHFLTFLINF